MKKLFVFLFAQDTEFVVIASRLKIL